MIIYYNPADNLVMAVFETDTSSTAWTDRGYVRATMPDEFVADVYNHQFYEGTRDCQVTVDGGGAITGCASTTNPLASTATPDEVQEARYSLRLLRASGRAKLVVLGLTEDEVEAL